jgi:hypothetical protein
MAQLRLFVGELLGMHWSKNEGVGVVEVPSFLIFPIDRFVPIISDYFRLFSIGLRPILWYFALSGLEGWFF